MLHRFGQGHKPPDTSRSGIEESGARTAADAKRPKSIVSEGAERWEQSDRVLPVCDRV